jgi:glucoamylase
MCVFLGGKTPPVFAFPPLDTADVTEWVEKQAQKSLSQILSNIQYAELHLGARPGAIVASPSHTFDAFNGVEQNYRYHWVRDSALVINTLIDQYKKLPKDKREEFLKGPINKYIVFSALNQQLSGPANLGEPKYELNGAPYLGEWGRPQNDGPALRALALMEWIEILLEDGYQQEAESVFRSVVTPDLSYTVESYGKASYDIWEEVRGEHFYVLLLQRTALKVAQRVEKKLNLNELALYHGEIQKILDYDLSKFKSEKRGVIEATREPDGGHVKDKNSKLDIATIYAVLLKHRFNLEVDEEEYSVLDSWVLSTAEKLRKKFSKIYPINQRGYPGTLMGRYPEDKYFGGNPWPIATLAMAELHFRLALALTRNVEFSVDQLNKNFLNQVLRSVGAEPLLEGERLAFASKKRELLIQSLFKMGDIYLARVRFHASDEGYLYEQFDRHTGFATALSHLSWSHSSFLDATLAREEAYKKVFSKTCEELLR